MGGIDSRIYDHSTARRQNCRGVSWFAQAGAYRLPTEHSSLQLCVWCPHCGERGSIYTMKIGKCHYQSWLFLFFFFWDLVAKHLPAPTVYKLFYEHKGGKGLICLGAFRETTKEWWHLTLYDGGGGGQRRREMDDTSTGHSDVMRKYQLIFTYETMTAEGRHSCEKLLLQMINRCALTEVIFNGSSSG